MERQGLYYYDRCMPMGCSSSCQTFEAFSTAIEWIAQHKLEVDKLLHLLDDFLFVSATYIQCQSNLKRFICLCNQLGIPIAPDKTFGPSTSLTFACIELQKLVYGKKKRKKVCLQELQSLIGLDERDHTRDCFSQAVNFFIFV